MLASSLLKKQPGSPRVTPSSGHGSKRTKPCLCSLHTTAWFATPLFCMKGVFFS